VSADPLADALRDAFWNEGAWPEAARAARWHIAHEVRDTARSLDAVGDARAAKTAYGIAVQIERGEP
jgi:hypothetical protein